MDTDSVEALRATIHRLHAAGHRPGEIARLAGCSNSSVSRTLTRQFGPDRRRHAAIANPAAVATIVDLARAGLSVSAIAERLVASFGSAAPSLAAVERLVAELRRKAEAAERGPTDEDRAAAAAADPDSLDAEVEILRVYVYALRRQIAAASDDDHNRIRLRLLRELRDLIDCISRAFRASHAVPAENQDERDQVVGQAGEDLLTKGETNGTHHSAPTPATDAAGA